MSGANSALSSEVALLFFVVFMIGVFQSDSCRPLVERIELLHRNSVRQEQIGRMRTPSPTLV